MPCKSCINWSYIGKIEDVNNIQGELRTKLGVIPPINKEDKNIYGYCKKDEINALKASETFCDRYSPLRRRDE